MIHGILIASLLICQGNEIAKPSEFIDSLYSSFDDVSFEYEGEAKSILPDRFGKSDMFAYVKFSGFMRYRPNGQFRESVFLHNIDYETGKTTTSRKKIALMNGEKRFVRTTEEGSIAEISRAVYSDFQYQGGTFDLYMVPYLRELSKLPGARLIHEGTAESNGRNCDIFTFYMRQVDEKSPIEDATFVRRYYLDMQRGGLPIKSERLTDGAVKERVEIELAEFKVSTEKTYWFPVRSLSEIIRKDVKGGQNNSVSHTTEVRVMKGSLKFDSGLKDGDFRFAFDQGTHVQDKINNKTYFFGKLASTAKNPVNLLESQELLDQLISEGENQRTEVIAGSVSRNGFFSTNNWLFYSFVFVGLSGLGLAFHLMRRT